MTTDPAEAAAPVDVLTYGETMGLLQAEQVGPLRLGGSLRLSIAGAETTVAIGVARLRGTARWVGVVGDDEIGRMIVRNLDAERVLTDGIAVDPDLPTGLLLQERRTSEVTRVHYYRTGLAGSRLAPEHVCPGHVASAKFLHLSGITPALSATAAEAVMRVLDLASAGTTRVCLDLNYRARLWDPETARKRLRDLIARADVVLATREEGELMVGPTDSAAAAAAALAALGPPQVVVKLGSEGAVAWDDGNLVEVSPQPTTVADPVGAGDAFAAGLLADLTAGRPFPEALTTAATVAGINVACRGDWEGLPTRAELGMSGADVLR